MIQFTFVLSVRFRYFNCSVFSLSSAWFLYFPRNSWLIFRKNRRNIYNRYFRISTIAFYLSCNIFFFLSNILTRKGFPTVYLAVWSFSVRELFVVPSDTAPVLAENASSCIFAILPTRINIFNKKNEKILYHNHISLKR